MGEATRKKSRYQRLLENLPTCCFCGGVTPSSTVDHVPPQACFRKGYFPEGFEFPACELCNSSTKDDDQIFGYHIQLGDPDLANKDIKTILRLQDGVRNNYRTALPNLTLSDEQKKAALLAMGLQPPPDEILRHVPVARLSDDFQKAASTIGRKLACALYFRETKKILATSHFIWTACFHLPNPRSRAISDYLAKLLPDQTIGGRTNIKEYGRRFGYKSGYKSDDDFFVCACQFGAGFVVLSITGLRERRYSNVPEGELHSVFPVEQAAS